MFRFVPPPPESNHFLTGQNNLTHASDGSGEKAQPAASIQPSTFLVCAVRIQVPVDAKSPQGQLFWFSVHTHSSLFNQQTYKYKKKVFHKLGSTVLRQTLMLFQPFLGKFSAKPHQRISVSAFTQPHATRLCTTQASYINSSQPYSKSLRLFAYSQATSLKLSTAA